MTRIMLAVPFVILGCQASQPTLPMNEQEPVVESPIAPEPSDPFYRHDLETVVSCFEGRVTRPHSIIRSEAAARGGGWPNSDLGWPTITLGPEIAGYAPEPSYGFTPDNPIRYGISDQRALQQRIAFLGLLRDLNGRPFEFERVGDCCGDPGDSATAWRDTYQLSIQGADRPVFIYFVADDSRQQPVYVPDCLTLVGYDTQPSDQCVVLTEGDVQMIRQYCSSSVRPDDMSDCFRAFAIQYCAQYNWGDSCAELCWSRFWLLVDQFS